MECHYYKDRVIRQITSLAIECLRTDKLTSHRPKECSIMRLKQLESFLIKLEFFCLPMPIDPSCNVLLNTCFAGLRWTFSGSRCVLCSRKIEPWQVDKGSICIVCTCQELSMLLFWYVSYRLSSVPRVLCRKLLIEIRLFIALTSIFVSLESCLKCALFDWQIEVLDLRFTGLVSGGISQGWNKHFVS